MIGAKNPTALQPSSHHHSVPEQAGRKTDQSSCRSGEKRLGGEERRRKGEHKIWSLRPGAESAAWGGRKGGGYTD